MSVYGKDFARIFDEQWGKRINDTVWPFVSKLVAERLPLARTWLDLCCGTGQLLALANRAGFETVGVDASRNQLARARKNAPATKLLCRDVGRFRLGQTFDVITCLGDSLNYILRKNDLLRAMRAATHHLAPGGMFVFDVNTFEGLQDVWCSTSTMADANWTVIVTSSFDAKRAIGQAEITGFVRQGRLYRKFVERHVERGYRAAEIDDLLTRAGLSFRKIDGQDL
ncbi:MAG: class I SAM-dependent DNA methyltransferase, partial [Planctomycetota bacterium]